MKPEQIKTHPFLDRWRVNGYNYIVIPKPMVLVGRQYFGLELEHVILYAVLRDRVNLSAKNGWIDDSGRVYIRYTRVEAGEYLGLSKATIENYYNQLIDVGLIEEKEPTGRNLKNNRMLYVNQWQEPDELFHPIDSLRKEGFPQLTKINVGLVPSSYYVIPKILFEDEVYKGLGLPCILLYCLALDELHRSMMNGTVDDNGLCWCNLDEAEICEILNCSSNTFYTRLKKLNSSGLFHIEKEPGSNRNRIYIRDYLPPTVNAVPGEDEEGGSTKFYPTDAQILSHGCPKSIPRMPKFYPTIQQNLSNEVPKTIPRSNEFYPEVPQILSPSNISSQNSRNQINSNKPFSEVRIQPSAGAAGDSVEREQEYFEESLESAALQKAQKLEEIKAELFTQLEYEALLTDIARTETQSDALEMTASLDLCISVMASLLANQNNYIMVNGHPAPLENAKYGCRQLTKWTMYSFLLRMQEHRGEIKNETAYIRKSLVTAYIDHEAGAERARNRVTEANRQFQMRRLMERLQA